MPTPSPLATHLVLYDGVCGLCDSMVQWLLAHDPQRKLSFAPLQGATAAAVRARHPQLPTALDTIVYVVNDGDDERVSLRSEAAFRIAADLDLSWVAPLALLPRALTDLGYRVIAGVRYRLWRRLSVCRVPAAADASRFLD